ncbi:MAG TPA: hypothetical protein VFC46_00625, partial [Humisphaera sp.]|nr:hypothetical protein [Humisphaera sp.]
AHNVPMAISSVSELAPAPPSRPPNDRELDHSPPPEAPPPFEHEGGPHPRGGPGPWDGPPDSHNSNRPQQDDGQHANRPGPGQPRPDHLLHDQQHERWHRAEAQQTIGLVSVATGLILLLVGVVRIGFAKVEQRFATESDDTAAY